MAIRTIGLRIRYRDAKGWMGGSNFFVSGDASLNTPSDFASAADTLITAYSALTNAVLQSTSGIDFEGIATLDFAYGTNAEYASEWMKAVYTFRAPGGVISRFKIPAPVVAQFELDKLTVQNDGTNTAVDNFISAVKTADASGTYISTRTGLAYTHFVGGILRLGKQPRRFNENIKSAKLVAGEGE